VNRRQFLTVVAGSTFCSAASRAATSSKRPNVLIFMADDQYRGSVGCYGADPSHTPNIDRFAESGLRFTNCFTPSSICTPNRGAFLSGMMPLKNGAHANNSGFYDGVKSMPNYMKDLGYRACLVNKDGIQKPSDIYEWEHRILESDDLAPGGTIPRSRRHRRSRFDELEAFLTSDDDRPFCLVHASRQPHSPYFGRLPNGLEGYDASNHYMDSEFGRDLELLDKHGLSDNTIVIYVNDNEAGIPRSKYTLYDTGLCVPCIIRWPVHTRSHTTSDAMISFTDFLPTLVDILGGDADPQWDGKSLVPLLEGRTTEHHEGLYFSYTGVSVGSNRIETPYPIRAYRTRRYKYIRNLNYKVRHPNQTGPLRPRHELYNLELDPLETQNMEFFADLDPVMERLGDKIDEWMQKTGDKGIESELELLRRYATP